MKAVYLDSSASVKIVAGEPEASALRAFLAREGSARAASALLRTEAIRAIRHLGPDALATTREALRRVDLVTVDDRILDAAAVLEPAWLRTLDAIHLATALALGDDLGAIVTYDRRMTAAAATLGLRTVSPA